MNWTKQKSKQKSEYVTKYPKVAQNGMLDCNKSAICLNTSDTERVFIYQFPVWKSP